VLPETYTPVFDSLVRELGLSSALVYGVIWRYCQMRENVCRASLGTMAARAGMSRRTVIRQVKMLVGRGYITDLTPGLKHAPHSYVDARMPEDVSGGDRQAIQECQNVHSGVTGGHPGSDRESPQEGLRVTPGVTGGHPWSDWESLQECHKVTGGVTQSHPNKTLLRESLREYLRDDRRDTQAPNFSKPSKTLLEAVRVSSQ